MQYHTPSADSINSQRRKWNLDNESSSSTLTRHTLRTHTFLDLDVCSLPKQEVVRRCWRQCRPGTAKRVRSSNLIRCTSHILKAEDDEDKASMTSFCFLSNQHCTAYQFFMRRFHADKDVTRRITITRRDAQMWFSDPFAEWQAHTTGVPICMSRIFEQVSTDDLNSD